MEKAWGLEDDRPTLIFLTASSVASPTGVAAFLGECLECHAGVEDMSASDTLSASTKPSKSESSSSSPA
jgi:hypothetical protein